MFIESDADLSVDFADKEYLKNKLMGSDSLLLHKLI